VVGLWWVDHKVLPERAQGFKPYLVALWQKAGRALFLKPSSDLLLTRDLNLELSVLARDE
jgi:hypothetical protein